jgi:hypothetical protein
MAPHFKAPSALGSDGTETPKVELLNGHHMVNIHPFVV